MILEERYALPYHIQASSHLYVLAGTCYTDTNKTKNSFFFFFVFFFFFFFFCNVVAFGGVSYDLPGLRPYENLPRYTPLISHY